MSLDTPFYKAFIIISVKLYCLQEDTSATFSVYFRIIMSLKENPHGHKNVVCGWNSVLFRIIYGSELKCCFE